MKHLLLAIGVIGLLTDRQDPATAPAALQGAAAHTWVKLSEEASGGREWPMFHFIAATGGFVLSGGGHEGPVHFDTEVFDLASATWRNAYPKNVPYKNETGPTDAPAADF